MNSTSNNKLEFSLEWRALKLLGKSLYSNPWAAISELTANGIDAGASKVYIHINFGDNKENSSIEVFDNGEGMSIADMENYIKIGYDKRQSPDKSQTKKYMGRKGIGKLSALYLSDTYILSTKKLNGPTYSWKVDVQKGIQNSSRPVLETSNPIEDMALKEKFEESSSGTYLQITNVNFQGIGERAVDALRHKIANQFILGGDTECEVLLGVSEKGQGASFEPVNKNISFKNFSVFCKLSSEEKFPSEVKNYLRSEKSDVIYYMDGKKFTKPPVIRTYTDGNSGEGEFTDTSGKKVSKPYELTGWLGLHASIEISKAQENDPSFKKNKYYTPCQIRLYVRDKLAVENISPLLGITQASLNYIEGEVSFDLLDLDDLPDIATTNRQSFDENDERFRLLIDIVKTNVKKLIRERDNLLKEGREKIRDSRDLAKTEFINEIESRLDQEKLPSKIKDNIIQAAYSGLEGDISAKEDYKVFISHASRDKSLCDIIYWMLRELGVEEEEIFYTSQDTTHSRPLPMEPLSEQIKEWITSSKTKILYVTSENFMGSQFCMFEGGAGWATRGTDDYSLLPVKYEKIPDFLLKGTQQSCLNFDSDNKPILDRKNYFLFIDIINDIVDFINKGRDIKGMKEVKKVTTIIPESPYMDPGKSDEDYMDENFIKYWKSSNIESYSVLDNA